MTRLSVNLNKVALLRNSRTLGIPSVVRAGVIVLDAGAQGLTVHPRPDQRHIRPHDVFELAELLRSRPNIEYNIEGNPFENMLEYAHKVHPHQCTLVPDDPAQFTSDHGWDLSRDALRLQPIIKELKSLGIRVSLFMDADAQSMARAAEAGADCVELYTEPYAKAYGTSDQTKVLAQFAAAAGAARKAGLLVNAGHDLNRANLAPFLAAVRSGAEVAEVSIGHAFIADALEAGLAATTRDYLAEIERGNKGAA
jgi:pyridoxine 5-phosphate synthase